MKQKKTPRERGNDFPRGFIGGYYAIPIIL